MALSRAVLDRGDRGGAGDLLVRARLCRQARRGARRAHDDVVAYSRRGGSARQDRCLSAFHDRRRDGGLGTRLSRTPARRSTARTWRACNVLDGLSRRYSYQRAAYPDGGWTGGSVAFDPRPLGALAPGAAAASWDRLALPSRPAVVHRHLRARWHTIPGRLGRRGHARQSRKFARGSWRTAGDLRASVLRDFLSCLDPGRARG